MEQWAIAMKSAQTFSMLAYVVFKENEYNFYVFNLHVSLQKIGNREMISYYGIFLLNSNKLLKLKVVC